MTKAAALGFSKRPTAFWKVLFTGGLASPKVGQIASVA